MALTPATFKILFPAFAGETDDRIQLYLDFAAGQMSPEAWGALFDQGQGYLTADMLETTFQATFSSGVAGDVSSIESGDRKTTFTNTSSTTTGTRGSTGTPYRKQYEALLNTLPAGVGFVVGWPSTYQHGVYY